MLSWNLKVFPTETLVFVKNRIKEENEIKLINSFGLGNSKRSETAKKSRLSYLIENKYTKGNELNSEESNLFINHKYFRIREYNSVPKKNDSIIVDENINIDLSSKNQPKISNHMSKYIKNYINVSTEVIDITNFNRLITTYETQTTEGVNLNSKSSKTNKEKYKFINTSDNISIKKDKVEKNIETYNNYLNDNTERELSFKKHQDILFYKQNKLLVEYNKSLLEEKEKDIKTKRNNIINLSMNKTSLFDEIFLYINKNLNAQEMEEKSLNEICSISDALNDHKILCKLFEYLIKAKTACLDNDTQISILENLVKIFDLILNVFINFISIEFNNKYKLQPNLNDESKINLSNNLKVIMNTNKELTLILKTILKMNYGLKSLNKLSKKFKEYIRNIKECNI